MFGLRKIGTLAIAVLWCCTMVELAKEAATLDKANPDFLGPGAYFRLHRKSRNSSPVVNAMFPFTQDLPKDTTITWNCFQKVNNAWKSTVIKGTAPFCNVIESKNSMQHQMLEFSTFPEKCPVKKGNYSIVGFKLNAGGPPVMSEALWKTRVSWATSGTIIMVFTLETKVQPTSGRHDNPDSAIAAALSSI